MTAIQRDHMRMYMEEKIIFMIPREIWLCICSWEYANIRQNGDAPGWYISIRMYDVK